jgi:cytosine/adenosine deaminase-related metal-dependent hydrolase
VTRQRTLVRGGHVLTVDPAIGDLPAGDVLIEDGVIVVVAHSPGTRARNWRRQLAPATGAGNY